MLLFLNNRGSLNSNEPVEYYTAPPVCMSDDEDLSEDLRDVDPTMKDSPEYKELLQLLKMQKNAEKKKNEVIISEKTVEVIHEGFKCDNCLMDPIVGVRWKCEECEFSYNVCHGCKLSANFQHHHQYFIPFETVEQKTYFLDYIQDEAGLNYLDPNYAP